jgi:hypothetical protein
MKYNRVHLDACSFVACGKLGKLGMRYIAIQPFKVKASQQPNAEGKLC